MTATIKVFIAGESWCESRQVNESWFSSGVRVHPKSAADQRKVGQHRKTRVSVELPGEPCLSSEPKAGSAAKRGSDVKQQQHRSIVDKQKEMENVLSAVGRRSRCLLIYDQKTIVDQTTLNKIVNFPQSDHIKQSSFYFPGFESSFSICEASWKGYQVVTAAHLSDTIFQPKMHLLCMNVCNRLILPKLSLWCH